METTGPMANDMQAEFQNSMQAALSMVGSPCPPHSVGAVTALQPAPAQAR